MKKFPVPAEDELIEIDEEAVNLIKGDICEEISTTEEDKLKEWVNKNDDNQQVYIAAIDINRLAEGIAFLNNADTEGRHDKIKVKLVHHPYLSRRRIMRMRPWTVAASVVVTSLAVYFLVHKDGKQTIIPVAKQEIPHGARKAILKLPDDSTIRLENAGDSTLLAQNEVIIKRQNGEINHIPATANNKKGNQYSTIVTERGGTYSLVLSDGTRVWLNAASSLKFPVAFAGRERRVFLTGEAYFEVSHVNEKGGSKRIPFIVDLVDKKSSVEVLGTHFNINAYPEEPSAKVTLLEGAVKVINDDQKAIMLKPAEELRISETGPARVNKHADTAMAVAWKNEQIKFNNSEFAAIMRQIGRWYNVDVVYKGSVPKRNFNASISRNTPFPELVEILNRNDIPCRVEARRLVIDR